MFRKSLTAIGCLLATGVAVSAGAQDYKVEITGFVGYTLSEGIDGDTVIVDGVAYNSINPTNAPSYGFTFGVFVTENVEVGFLYDEQQSNLEIKGPGVKEEVADLKLRNYHGIFTYNWGYGDSQMRDILDKMYRNGSEEAEQFLIKRYSRRGFDHLASTISAKIAEVEA